MMQLLDDSSAQQPPENESRRDGSRDGREGALANERSQPRVELICEVLQLFGAR
jgi:hypothetical protein